MIEQQESNVPMPLRGSEVNSDVDDSSSVTSEVTARPETKRDAVAQYQKSLVVQLRRYGDLQCRECKEALHKFRKLTDVNVIRQEGEQYKIHINNTHKRIPKLQTNIVSKKQSKGSEMQEAQDARKEDSDFEPPTKVSKFKHFFRQKPSSVITNNRFQPLDGEEPIDMQTETFSCEEDEVPHSNGKNKESKFKKRLSKPPPIVIKGKLESHKLFMQEIKKVTQNPIIIKYAKFSVIVYTENKQDHDAVRNSLDLENLEYHTYTQTEEKTHAFVLKGLDGTDITAAEIKEELWADYKIKVYEIYKMKNTVRLLYLVVTDATQTLSKLNRNATILMNTRVRWELRRNQKQIVQCQRCQIWGHSKQNCRRKFRCSRCAQEHEITACPYRERQPKCANCGGEHRAISTKCPVYKYKMEQLKQTTAKYVPAPVPKTNIWESRRNLSSQQQARRNDVQAIHTAIPEHQREEKRSATAYPIEEYDRHFPDTLSGRKCQKTVDSSPPGDIGGKFQTLRSKFQELNELVNLDEMIAAVNHYVEMLRDCSDNISRFQVSNKFFTSEIFKFNI